MGISAYDRLFVHGGPNMRKITLLLAVLALAALPSTADAAKKRRQAAAQPAAQAQPVDPNEASGRFVRDAFPVFLPSWAIPTYLSTVTEGPHAPQAAKAAKAKDAKQARRTRQARQQ
jgi:hypothetical protein